MTDQSEIIAAAKILRKDRWGWERIGRHLRADWRWLKEQIEYDYRDFTGFWAGDPPTWRSALAKKQAEGRV